MLPVAAATSKLGSVPNPSSGLFSQYGKLQVLLISRIVSILAIVYVATFVLFAVLRVFTGVSIKRIGYLCLRHITFHTRSGVEVKIGKVGLSLRRPTIARPGWVSFIIDSCEITVNPDALQDHEARADAEGEVDAARNSHTLQDQFEEGVQPIPLVPANKPVLRRIVKWLLLNLKVLDIRLTSTAVTYPGLTTVVVSTVDLALDLRNLPSMRSNKFVGTLDNRSLDKNEINAVVKFTVHDIYAADSIDDETPQRLLDYFVFDVQGVLNCKDLGLRELAFDFTVGKVFVPVDYVHRVIGELRHLHQKEPVTREPASAPAPAPGAKKPAVLNKREKRRLAKTGVRLIYLVKQVDFKIDMCEVSGIRPPSPINDHCGNPVTLAASMEDVNLTVRRMNPLSASFKLLYESSDSAHQAIFNAGSINVGLAANNVLEEILYIPLVTLVSRTNLLSRTLEYLQDDSATFNQSSVVAALTVTSPNVNIETHQLPVLLQICRNPHHKVSAHHPWPTPPVESPFTIDLPFQNILPQAKISVTIVDAAVRLVVDSSTRKESMFILSAARITSTSIGQHATSTSPDSQKSIEAYNLQNSLDITKGRVWYSSPTLPEFIISSSDSLSFSIDATTQPIVSVSLSADLSEVLFNSTKYEIFDTVRCLIVFLRQNIPPRRHLPVQHVPKEDLRGDQPHVKASALRMLPPWLRLIKINIRKVDLVAASDRFRYQTGNLLGLQLTMDKLNISYDRDHGTKNRSVFTDGRKFELSLEGVHSYRVENVFIAHQKEENAAKQADCLDIPSVSCSALTETQGGNQRVMSVSVNVPKVTTHVNINLLLALMVIREVIDHSLDHGSAPDPATETVDDVNKAETMTVKERVAAHVSLGHLLVKLDLPYEDHIMLELVEARLQHMSKTNPVFAADSVKLYSRHPFSRDTWCIIMSFVQLKGLIKLIHRQKDDDLINLDLNGIRINVPYKFKLYRIIDNGITLAKAIKTLILQTRVGDPYLILKTVALPILPNIPKVKVKSRSILLALEDDPFESRLGLILKTAAIELDARIQKELLFEHKVKEVMKKESDRLVQETLHDMHSRPPTSRSSSTHKASGYSMSNRSRSSSISDISELSDAEEYPAKGGIANESNANYHSNPLGRTQRSTSGNGKVGTGTEGGDHQKLRNQFNKHLQGMLDTPLDATTAYHGNDDHKWSKFFHDPQFCKFREFKTKFKGGHSSRSQSGSRSSQDGGVGKAEDHVPEQSLADIHEALLKQHSDSWKRLIDSATDAQMKGVKTTQDELFADPIDKTTAHDEPVVGYSQHPLLFSANFRDAVLHIGRAHFDTEEAVRDFMYDVGKGIPKTTLFDIFVPLWLDIKAPGGLRVDLRDFPLPVVHFPPLEKGQDPKTSNALHVKGNFIIAEQLNQARQNIRRLFVPLKQLPAEKREIRGTAVLEVHRTLSPIKMYTDLSFYTQTKLPTRVTWCPSYGPAFSLMSAGFSNFSKPPLDISPPLGFWDKIRLNFQARMNFRLENSPLYLLLKGSRDPYKLTGTGAGFAFVWKDNVQVHINPDNDSKNLIVVDADVFQTVIPNFSEWEENYCKRSPGERAFPHITNFNEMAKPQKVVMNFSDSTKWKLGMEIERDVKEGDPAERTTKFRPHYDVHLSMPEFVKDPKTYDAYRGFRSTYLFMAISVASENSNTMSGYNSAHLTPNVIAYFKRWTKMFSSVNWPPQRTGPLFPGMEEQTAPKFGNALSGQQYQLKLSPLFLSYCLRHSSLDHQRDHAAGLKARVDEFIFDLHARKEPVPGQKRWKTNLHIGEVGMLNMEVRAITARFRDKSVGAALDDMQMRRAPGSLGSRATSINESVAGTATTTSGHGHALLSREDTGWIDPNDFVELGVVSHGSDRTPTVDLDHFIYAPRFSYYHQTDNSGRLYGFHDGVKYKKFGDEILHDCQISSNFPEEVQIGSLKERFKALEEDLEDAHESLDSLTGEDQRHPNNPQIAGNINMLKRRIQIIQDGQGSLHSEIANLTRELNSYKPHEQNKQRGFNATLYGCGDKTLSESCEGDHDSLSRTLYRNQFMIHSMHVKWNNKIRDLIFRLITLTKMQKQMDYNTSRRAVRYLEELVQKIEKEAKVSAGSQAGGNTQSEDETPVLQKILDELDFDYKSGLACTDSKRPNVPGEERLRSFNDDLVEVNTDTEKKERSFLVRFMTPQFQIISSKNPADCVQVTARDVELRIVSVIEKDKPQDDASAEIEKRYGVSFIGAAAYVLQEDNVKENLLSSFCVGDHGTDPNAVAWPPWLTTEFCYGPGVFKRFLVIDNTNFAVRFDHFNTLHVHKEGEKTSTSSNGQNGAHTGTAEGTSNESSHGAELSVPPSAAGAPRKKRNHTSHLRIDAPQLVVACDSVQYNALYTIVRDLISYTDPIEEETKKAIERVVLGTDFTTDLPKSLWQIKSFQSELIVLNHLRDNLLFSSKFKSAFKQTKEDLLSAELEYRRGTLDFLFMMQAFKTALRKCNRTHTSNTLITSVHFDNLSAHVLNGSGKEILEVSLERGDFNRVRYGDRYSINGASIGLIKGWNLLPDATYPDMILPLSAHNDQKPLVKMTWVNLDPVGGITIIEEFILSLQPLKVQLEREIYDKLFKFAFPNGKDDDKDDKDKEGRDLVHTRVSIESGSDTDSLLQDMQDYEEKSMLPFPKSHKKPSANESQSKHSSKIWKFGKILKRMNDSTPDDVSEMIDRAASYLNIVSFIIEATRLSISYKGKGQRNLLDLQEVEIATPEFAYHDKMWTKLDLFSHLKKDLIKVALHNSGAILQNKFTPHVKAKATVKRQSILDREHSGLGLKKTISKLGNTQESSDTHNAHNVHGSTPKIMEIIKPRHKTDSDKHVDKASTQQEQTLEGSSLATRQTASTGSHSHVPKFMDMMKPRHTSESGRHLERTPSKSVNENSSRFNPGTPSSVSQTPLSRADTSTGTVASGSIDSPSPRKKTSLFTKIKKAL